MTYADMTYNSRSRLKRWSHNSRFTRALHVAGQGACHTRRILDFGAGDGYFSEQLKANWPSADIVAYDPSPEMIALIEQRRCQGIVAISSEDELRPFFDMIFCLEVLEHLSADGIQSVINKWRGLTTPNSTIVISVPIETGLAGLAKNFAREALGQSHEKRSVRDHARVFWGRPVQREETSYISSHFGFDHRKLKRELQHAGFVIEKENYSPTGTSLISSQVIWRTRLQGR